MSRAFGVMLLQNRPVAELAEWATAFDRAGADAVYVADHLANPHDLADEWYDAWVVLAAVAAATSGLADVVGQLWEMGYDEVAVYAWFARDQGPRTPESLLGFVEHRLPGLR